MFGRGLAGFTATETIHTMCKMYRMHVEHIDSLMGSTPDLVLAGFEGSEIPLCLANKLATCLLASPT